MEILVGTKTSEASKREIFNPDHDPKSKHASRKHRGSSHGLYYAVLPRSTPYWFVVQGLPPSVQLNIINLRGWRVVRSSGLRQEAGLGWTALWTELL